MIHQYSARYIKTLYNENLSGNFNYELELDEFDSIVTYLNDLIMDLKTRRKFEHSIIVLTDSYWLGDLLNQSININTGNPEPSFYTDYINNFYNELNKPPLTSNHLFITINYSNIVDKYADFFELLKLRFPQSSFIGIDLFDINRNQKLRIGGPVEVKSIFNQPSNFVNFANKEILDTIEELISKFNNYHELSMANNLIFVDNQEIDDENEYSIKFGTSGYTDSNEDIQELEESHELEIPQALLYIKFSKYELEFILILEDYDWDNTKSFNFYYNYQDEIIEDINGNLNELDKYMEEFWSRYKNHRDAFKFNFEGF